MSRVAHPYTRWEDYLAGMYGKSPTPAGHVDQAVELLTDITAFEKAMWDMVQAWPRAAEHWLSRPGAKSRSWLGAAACMWAVGSPEVCTRTAWWILTAQQKDAANEAADAVRELWKAQRTQAEECGPDA